MSREEIIVLHFMCGGVCVQMETLLIVINKREPLKMPSGWCTVALLQYRGLESACNSFSFTVSAGVCDTFSNKL